MNDKICRLISWKDLEKDDRKGGRPRRFTILSETSFKKANSSSATRLGFVDVLLQGVSMAILRQVRGCFLWLPTSESGSGVIIV